MRSRENFDFGWKFLLVTQPTVQAVNFADTSWQSMSDLPHVMGASRGRWIPERAEQRARERNASAASMARYPVKRAPPCLQEISRVEASRWNSMASYQSQ